MIDRIDKKILFELDSNSRLSNQKIAKNLHLTKERVNYRIKKLIKNKVITRFFSEIDFSKFGYYGYKIYLQFQDINKKKEEEIWQYLSKHPNAIWMVKCTGKWDAIFGFVAEDITEFNDILLEFLNKYGQYVQNKQIVTNISHYIYSRKWLVDSQANFITKFGGKIEKIKIDKRDRIILRELAKNSKTPVIELSEKTGLSAPQVLYRIKNLIKKKILISFKIDIDLSKFNYQFCKVFLNLKNISIKKKNNLIKFCVSQKNITALSEVIAPWDIELEFEVENFNQLMDITSELRNRFSDIFRNFESVIITKESGRIHIPK